MNDNRKRVTIKDVAKKAGVSIGTVSRYIGNSGYVGRDSKENIAKAIAELGYIPNVTARSMINKRSRIVGVAVPEINNPFLADLVVRIDAGLSKKNYSIMLCNTGYNPKKMETFIDDLIMRNAEGVILVATDISEKKVLRKIKQYMQGVSVGQKILNFDSINFNDFRTAYDITRHLIRLGHKKIGCIGFNAYASQTVERLEGVMTALKDTGLAVDEKYMLGYDDPAYKIVEHDGGENGGYIFAKRLLELKDPPTAIVAINDFYAIGAYEAIYEMNLRVGEDISVMGFDDVNIAKFMTPSLTTVNCNTGTMADLAVALLTSKMADGETPVGTEEGKDIVLSSDIILRESVKPPEKAGKNLNLAIDKV